MKKKIMSQAKAQIRKRRRNVS